MTKDEKTGFPKPLIIVIIILIVLGVLRILIKAGLAGILLIGSIKSKSEVYEDMTRYREYMSFGAGSSDIKWNKWGMDETIWPAEITDTMQVSDFRMIYYDPWDKQYLGYLVVDIDYGMAKAALNMATMNLYNTFGDDDQINIFCVHPGWIRTDGKADNPAPLSSCEAAEILRKLFEEKRYDLTGPRFITNEGKEYPF